VARIAFLQSCAGLLIGLLAAWWTGWQGFVSGLLGGFVNVLAGAVFAVLVNIGRPATAGGTLRTMLRAEAAKITVIVLLLWLVLKGYHEVVPAAFFAAFVAAVLVSQTAPLIRN
jgi:ATP synthase protein I